jgi:hypothetical protein
VLVGFFLETDVAICFDGVSVFEEQDEPFESIPEEKGQKEQFSLLGCVDEFMVEFPRVERAD